MAITGTGGTINFIDNRPVITGSFSGFDTAALLEAQLAVRRLPAVKLENRITENDTKIAAFGELSGLLNTLGASLNALRNPPGLAGLESNIFEQNSIFLTSNSASTAPEILGATALNSASPGIYNIEVQQIATAHKISSSAIADTSAALGVGETLTIGLAGAPAEETFQLQVDPSSSAADIASAVNTQSSITGVRASLIQIAPGDTRLVFTAVETNKEISLIGDNGGVTTAALGISGDNGATYNNVLQAAQPAQILIDGIADPVVRDTNEISDLIPGVTLDLFKAEPGTDITLEIEPDLTAVRQSIVEFVESFNAVRTFLREQQTVNSEGEVAETAILFGDNLIRSLSTELGNDLSTIVSGLSNQSIATLRDLGIELDGQNLLTIDDGALDTALVDHLDEVRGLFEFGFQSDSSRVRLVGRGDAFDLGTFTIDIPAGAIDGTNVQVDGVDAFEVSGNTLRGLAGTVYEGFNIAYGRNTGDPAEAAESITITTSLGLAERLYQAVENYSNPVDGLLTDQVRRIEEQNSDYQTEIATIEERLVLVREALIAEYAALEQAIQQAEAISNQLQAFIDAGNRDR